MNSASPIRLSDVSLRDGIQNEPSYVSLTQRLFVLQKLIAAGVRQIQVGSFVRSDLIPQMKEFSEFLQLLPAVSDVRYSALVLNVKGCERFLESPLQQIDLSLSSSETHSRKNTGLSLSDARAQMRTLIREVKQAGREVRAGLQCVFGCAYEGKIETSTLLKLTDELIEAGADSICWADSTGMAHPLEVRRLADLYRERYAKPLILHLHDTRGLAMANMIAALDCGIRDFGAALGGLGACPFIPAAAGNIALEDIVAFAELEGYETGLKLGLLIEASEHLEAAVQHPLPSKAYQYFRKQLSGREVSA